MSLVKELGGYDEAKNEMNRLNDSEYAVDHCYAHEIGQALLHYRRENNIFEAGDYVIDEQYTGLLKVTRVMKKRLDVDYLNPQVMNHVCSSSILIRHVKHATKEEIEAGYKL